MMRADIKMKSKVQNQQDQTTMLVEKLRHACSIALGDLLALGMPAGASTGKLLLEVIAAAEKQLAEATAFPLPPGWQLVDDRIYVYTPSRDRDFRVPPGWRLVDAYIGLVDTDPERSRMQLPRGRVDVVLPSGALLPIGGSVPSDVDVVKTVTPNLTGGVSNWGGIQLVFEESAETAKAPPTPIVSNTLPIQRGFEYEVRLAVSIPLAWAKLLKEAGENHYDYKCREAAKCGVVNALYNTACDSEWPSTRPVTWRDLDLVTKVVEQLHHHTQDRSLIDTIRTWLEKIATFRSNVLCKWIYITVDFLEFQRTAGYSSRLRGPFHVGATSVAEDGSVLSYWFQISSGIDRAESLQVAAASLVGWTALSMINCQNIATDAHRAPDAFQKARKKSGKRPLVSFHTIRVDLDKTPRQVAAESLPGDGTTPRRHKKRGHMKDYRRGQGLFGRYKGVWYWGPTLAGSAEEGVVVSDYEVRP